MREFSISFPEIYDYRSITEVELQFDRMLKTAGVKITMWDPLEEAVLSQLYSEKIDAQFAFDLSRTQYVAFEQLATILVLGSFCQRITGQPVKVRFPYHSRVVDRFFYPYSFFDFFEEWGISLTPIKEPPDVEDLRPFLPLTRIASYADVRATARTLKKPKYEQELRRHFHFTDDDKNCLVDTIVSEVCDNIPFHSHSEGLIAVQVHKLKPNTPIPPDYTPFVDILICDSGIGILESLRQRYWDAYSRKTAIQTLRDVFEGAVPKPEGRMRGGLARVRSAIRDFGGILEVQTPFALGTSIKESQPGYRGRPHFFPGVLILDFSVVTSIHISFLDEFLVPVLQELRSSTFGDRYLIGANVNMRNLAVGDLGTLMTRNDLLFLFYDKKGNPVILGAANEQLNRALGYVQRTEKETAQQLALQMAIPESEATVLLLTLANNRLIRRGRLTADGPEFYDAILPPSTSSRFVRTSIEDELLDRLQHLGAIERTAHYQLPSGAHAAEFLHLSRIFEDARFIAKATYVLGDMLRERDLDVIITTKTPNNVVLAQFLGEYLNCRVVSTVFLTE